MSRSFLLKYTTHTELYDWVEQYLWFPLLECSIKINNNGYDINTERYTIPFTEHVTELPREIRKALTCAKPTDDIILGIAVDKSDHMTYKIYIDHGTQNVGELSIIGYEYDNPLPKLYYKTDISSLRNWLQGKANSISSLLGYWLLNNENLIHSILLKEKEQQQGYHVNLKSPMSISQIYRSTGIVEPLWLINHPEFRNDLVYWIALDTHEHTFYTRPSHYQIYVYLKYLWVILIGILQIFILRGYRPPHRLF